jgi:hypothetical protein
MKKLFLSIAIAVFALSPTLLFLSWQTNKKKKREFYQLTVYHFTTASQEKILDNYFQNALLPALHRNGTKNVGVFKSWANDTTADKLVYVLVPLKSLDALEKNKELLQKDQQYLTAALEYLDAEPRNPPYTRMENIVLRAFELAPQMQLPSLQAPKQNRVYELRSYEGATERKYENKVKMFNQGGEVDIFKRLNFNAIFYAEVFAGSRMPNLMYMTSFENRPDRDEHWKAFSNDSAWKKLSAMPEYRNNVSRITISYLYPAEYSDY